MIDPEPTPGMRLADMPVAVRPCSLAAALDVLGERWTLLALREIGYGVHRFARIAGFTGAPRDILADRLRKLEAAGVVERRAYSEHPPRHEYHVTEAGRELFPVMLALYQWGDKWAVDAPALVRWHTCGSPVQVDLVCHACGEPVTDESIHAEPNGSGPPPSPRMRPGRARASSERMSPRGRATR